MHASLGFALAVIGGLLMGSFSLPMKKTTKWAWETTWLVWAAVALVVTPWVIALNTVPDPLAVYREAGVGTLARVFLFGAGWGLGAVLFGQSIALLGMSLAFALSIGLTMALGALVPILSEPHLFLTPGGKALAAGVVVMLLGVAISALAGRQKERQAQAAAAGVTPKGSFVKGLTLCILSGIFNPMINFAYTFSDRIREAADAHGASAGGQSDAVWTITLLGGFATNLVYCSILLYRNRTWSGYRLAGTGSYWFL
ncbi:MAG TPA: L-rhamnose/proton symporter RhaT, partial [Phycisphaerae bacterium]|nr:L-rhamnose/proton symporter RhaT [Phycisphaerae bacterium]